SKRIRCSVIARTQTWIHGSVPSLQGPGIVLLLSKTYSPSTLSRFSRPSRQRRTVYTLELGQGRTWLIGAWTATDLGENEWVAVLDTVRTSLPIYKRAIRSLALLLERGSPLQR